MNKIIESKYPAIDSLSFSSIKDTLNGKTFPWYYQDYISFAPCENYKFYNEIIKNSNLTNASYVNYLNMLKPLFKEIEYKKLHYVSCQLLTQTKEHQLYLIKNFKKDSKLAILFANENNGGVEFKDNDFIQNKENKLILFDSNQEFSFKSCTDEKINTSVIINYN